MRVRVISIIMLILTTVSAQAINAKRVVCVGNSITYGTGIANRETDSYPAKLQQMLGDSYTVENYGKPGATLLNSGHNPYTASTEYSNSIAAAGDIVVIHLGINDTDPRNWPLYRDQFVGDYISLIEAYKEANPNSRIIISRLTPIQPTHPRFNSGTKQWHALIQQEIELVASETDVELIDLHKALYPYPHLFPDGLHPNEQGAEIMAKTIYSAITGNYGGLQLPAIYSDNMVLQRDMPIKISGTSDAGDKIIVSIKGETATAKTDNRGEWSVTLKPLKAGVDYTLRVRNKDTQLEYNNVMVGEVWLASGQSNMEFKLRDAEISERNLDLSQNDIRIYNMDMVYRTDEIEWSTEYVDSVYMHKIYAPTTWEVADSVSAANFSAIAINYAKILQATLKVPVGIICNAVGGAGQEAWIDRETLEYQYPLILNNWTANDFVQPWVRERALKNIANSTDAFKRHPYEPAYLFEAGILPLNHYSLRGVIWYQGESNAHNIESYEELFPLFVDSWRGYWNNPQMPIYYVQLSSLNRPSWTWFRDAQRKMASSIDNVGMAVSSDRGDSLDVHPTRKKDIGERLCRLALKNTYKMDIPAYGAELEEVKLYKTKLEIKFDNAKGLKTSDDEPVIGFEVATSNKQFIAVDATIKGDKVIIPLKSALDIKYIRYGWQPFTRANLVNGDNLPTSTFLHEVEL